MRRRMWRRYGGGSGLVAFAWIGLGGCSGRPEEPGPVQTSASETDGDGDPGDGDGDLGTDDGDLGDGDGEDPGTGDGDPGDGDGDPGLTGCGPIGPPPPEGPVVQVDPSMAAALPGLVAAAEPNTTFELADGDYDLSEAALLHVTTPGLRFVGNPADRGAVVLDAHYALGEIFLVAASNTTIAHLTVQRAAWHPIHVTGGAAADIEGTLIHDVAVVDPGQQGIKINPSGSGFYADHGTIACSSVSLTDAGRAQVQDCYTGGIDAHSAWGWLVRDSLFEGFWCAQGLSEHAIHFWVTARDTIVERNTIVDCARGIGFGLGADGNGNTRTYPDDPCPGAAGHIGHVDGEIRNNTIFASRSELFASELGVDSGIALEQACGARAYHNSVYFADAPFVAIEYRFPNTDVELVDNLVSHAIVMRDGGQAAVIGNLEGQGPEQFVDAGGGDLHLADGSAAIDAGDPLTLAWITTDLDGEARDAAPDVGADEVP